MYFNNYDIIFAHMFNSYSAVAFIGGWCLFHSVLTIVTFIWGWCPLEGRTRQQICSTHYRS